MVTHTILTMLIMLETTMICLNISKGRTSPIEAAIMMGITVISVLIGEAILEIRKERCVNENNNKHTESEN